MHRPTAWATYGSGAATGARRWVANASTGSPAIPRTSPWTTRTWHRETCATSRPRRSPRAATAWRRSAPWRRRRRRTWCPGAGCCWSMVLTRAPRCARCCRKPAWPMCAPCATWSSATASPSAASTVRPPVHARIAHPFRSEAGMRMLYPDIAPFDTGMLPVDGRHRLYYEQCGNPRGKPVVLLHGGPGGGCNTKMRCFHDPARYRIVLFDQRGAGRSTPHADLVDNTTWHLVDDIEALRRQLGIDRWQVFGGSWGSTLALAYAQKHPGQVTELVLRGIFMLRRWELEWFYQEGCSRLFPDAYADYVSAIPEVERGDLISAFHRRLTHEDPKIR